MPKGQDQKPNRRTIELLLKDMVPSRHRYNCPEYQLLKTQLDAMMAKLLSNKRYRALEKKLEDVGERFERRSATAADIARKARNMYYSRGLTPKVIAFIHAAVDKIDNLK